MAVALLRVGSCGLVSKATMEVLRPEVVHSAESAADIDELLAELPDGRLVIEAAGPGALNLALSRLLRRGLLASLDTAVLMPAPLGYLGKLGLPVDLADQLKVASSAPARLVGVLKDDSGGLCADSAELTPWTADAPWWLRAVVDDLRLCDGAARSLTVRRIGPAELSAQVRLGPLRRHTLRGRSLQLACDEAQIVADGIGRERPRRKRTFWADPALWRLALPQ